MPQIKSAIKRVAIAERNRLRNKAAKSTIRTLMKKFFIQAEAYAAGAEDVNLEQVQASMSAAFSKIDKAAGKGVMHRNTAARRKARLARTLKQAEATAANS
ncbi:MAG: 30S ribosomal protein S20 [Cyanobacteria bacterium J06642_2]